MKFRMSIIAYLVSIYCIAGFSQPQFREWSDPSVDPNQLLHTHELAQNFPTWDSIDQVGVSEDFAPRQLGGYQY